MQPYDGYNFYCPRTKSKIPYKPSPVLDMWKRYKDAVMQIKLNGNRNIIKVTPNRDIEFWRRRREEDNEFNRQEYTIPDTMREQILAISPPDVWTVWDTELLNAKTKHVKNVVYFFDCLVWESQHLLDVPYVERFAHCQRALGEAYVPMVPAQITGQLYIAQNFTVDQWDSTWLAAKETRQYAPSESADFCEGVVLKRTGDSSRLKFGDVIVNNSGFMCRIRKYTKNSNF